MSTVGVHGGSSGEHPIRFDSAIRPHTAYARSKADAELALAEVVRGTDMALTVLRPPLVYGPGAPGNFRTLMRAVARGWPLPLGSITNNLRSFVAIDNLVDVLVACLHHPGAANQTFLVSDGEDLSTVDLVNRLGAAVGRPARLLPVPLKILELSASVLGNKEAFRSLSGSLQVDMEKTQQLLNWVPPVTVDEGLRKATGSLQC